MDPDLQLAIHRSVADETTWITGQKAETDPETVQRFLRSLADKSISVECTNLLDDKTEMNRNLLPDAKCDKVLLQEPTVTSGSETSAEKKSEEDG